MSSIQTPARLEAWVLFLRAHAAITRQLNADLLNEHGLTLSDYEVLLRLSNAEGGMMRRVDLAESVLLTASGITRLLDGLERAGFVEKASCASDARVRSEERRVGKECRSRWWADEYKKKAQESES